MAALHIESSERALRVPQYLRTYFIASVILSCGLALLTTAVYFRSQPQLPIFYSLAEPNDYLADKRWIFVFPVISATVTILHVLLLPLMRSHHRTMNMLYAWLTLVVQALCLIAAVRIIWITW